MAAQGLAQPSFRKPQGRKPQGRRPRASSSSGYSVLLLAGLSLAAALGGLLLHRHHHAGSSSATAATAAVDEAAARNTRIAFFESRAKADPLDFVSRNLLASEYLQRGRETGDVTDYNLAEQAATSSLAILPGDNLAGIVLLASVRLVQHDYAAAETLAKQGLALKPTGASAMGVLGDAYVGLGQYDDAQKQFETMLQRAARAAGALASSQPRLHARPAR